MKKKIVVFLSALLLLFLSACGGGATAPETDTEKPWGTPTHAFERCAYSVEIFARRDEKSSDGKDIRVDDGLLADGRFIQTLSAQGDGAQNRATVKTELSVQWNSDDRAGANKGLTDIMESEVVFYTADCTPISSVKTAALSTRNDKNESYFSNTDYQALTSAVSFGKTDKDTEGYLDAKTVPFKSGVLYDNEQMFHLVRAFTALNAESGQVAVSINSAVQLYEQSLKVKKPAPPAFTMSTAAGTAEHTLGDFILDYLPAGTADAYPDDAAKAAAVNTRGISVYMTGQNSGPAHRFLVTEPGTIFTRANQKTSKLVVAYEYFVFDDSGKDIYRIAYNMTDYTTDRNK